MSVRNTLNELAASISSENDEDFSYEYVERLSVTEVGDLYHIDFYGDPFEEAYSWVLEALSSKDVAPLLKSIQLHGPDEGANGTRNWDIEILAKGKGNFDKLEFFSVQLNKPGDHNRTVIGADYDEDGVLAQLISKSPSLTHMIIPSAPDSSFFQVENKLKHLSVDAGYDTQDFIKNLANSNLKLTCLEWGEYNETYMDDFKENCTSIEDYKLLFNSKTMDSITRMVLRNPILGKEEIIALKKIRPNLQLLIVHCSEYYA